MAGKDNLIPQAHTLTVAEQSAGGKASAESRRKAKSMREWAKVFGAMPVKVKGPDGSLTDSDTLGAIMAAQMAKASKGDTKAAKFVAELLGEMEKTINVKTPAPLVISDAEAKALDKWTEDK
jgi:hypothetical protein